MTNGKTFEKTVSLIEDVLKANSETSVKHNKNIVDQIGVKRQIDVYIESNLNGHSIKVAIECKDHKSKIKIEDIDSFDSKTKRLAVDKRVYVSRNGYQSGAVETAKAVGIELCTLQDLSPHAVASWVNPTGMSVTNRIYEFVAFKLNLAPGAPIEEIKVWDQSNDSIFHGDRSTKITLDQMRQNLMDQLIKSEDKTAPPVAGNVFRINFEFPSSAYHLKFKDNFYRIMKVEAEVHIKIEERIVPFTSIRKYSQVEGSDLAEIASMEIPGHPSKPDVPSQFSLNFIRSGKSGLTKVALVPKEKA